MKNTRIFLKTLCHSVTAMYFALCPVILVILPKNPKQSWKFELSLQPVIPVILAEKIQSLSRACHSCHFGWKNRASLGRSQIPVFKKSRDRDFSGFLILIPGFPGIFVKKALKPYILQYFTYFNCFKAYLLFSLVKFAQKHIKILLLVKNNRFEENTWLRYGQPGSVQY